ncbi:histidine phosphatase family protein [Schlesneria paludicola]|uniref:histidine phosphatase family protein n=1 Tax=Schlesneria paludicola TaxID=360056 RepID=UPI00029A7F01|nr:histidine phosphatase family protein [Schlesneria paludicola]
MKNLFLVRHAESQHHVGELTGGWTDVPLTVVGHRQARLLAQFFAVQLHGRNAQVYSSDLKRCRETAEPIASALQCNAVFTPELRELNNGTAAGRTKTEASKLRRPPVEPILDWVPYQGAESWRNLYRRIVTFADGLNRNDDAVVILVTHAYALICLVNWFMRIADDNLVANIMYDAAPGSITHLRVGDQDCRTIGFLNSSSHLENLSECRWNL